MAGAAVYMSENNCGLATPTRPMFADVAQIQAVMVATYNLIMQTLGAADFGCGSVEAEAVDAAKGR